MGDYIGYPVSIKCKKNTYQGEICSATQSELKLRKAFCDGIPCKAEVTILASDIVHVELLEQGETTEKNACSTVTITKPTAKRANKTQSLSESRPQNGSSSNAILPSKSKPIDIQPPNQPALDPNAMVKIATPVNKKDKGKQKFAKSWKDEACFGSPLDPSFSKEFDFEKNLALFDKQAVFEQINSQRPDIVKHADQRKATKYRHDENVIATIATTLRQISVPNDVYEYVTDDGLVIPSISRSLRKKLWAVADQVGLTWERRVELMGRATTEMAVHLLGGAHRLSPQNTHQWPTVAFLVGPSRQGGVGINAARQLASQGVKTIVYSMPAETAVNRRELQLYELTHNKCCVGLTQPPPKVDLVVVSMYEDGENMKQYSAVAEWIGGIKAPVLALDPPAIGTPGVTAKFSLVPVLPLAHSSNNGKIYLCNLGFPSEIFAQVNIKYKSPFGPKFVIPLHPNESA